MKKVILGVFFTILSSAMTLSAQVQKPSVQINRDRASIIQRLPNNIRSIIGQMRLPQPDAANRNTAMNGHSLNSSFTLSPDVMKIDGKGQVDFIGALLVATTGSALNAWGAPIAIIDAAGTASNTLGGALSGNSVALTVKNNQAGSLYLVDCNTYASSSIVVNSGQPQILTPNSNGHVYFVLTAGSNDDVIASISSSNGMWAFFSFEISKLN